MGKVVKLLLIQGRLSVESKYEIYKIDVNSAIADIEGTSHSGGIRARGGGNFLMSGIRVCATDQGRFFTSKNPEQAPNFEVLLQNRPYFLKVYSTTGPTF